MTGDLSELDAYMPTSSCLPDAYQGRLLRHAKKGDTRLFRLRYHLSATTHDLWNFLMTEEDRLHDARRAGKTIIGAMKDLGTLPILVDAFKTAIAFYPDGAWWLPCFKEQRTSLLKMADILGAGDGFCPVRAMLAAYELKNHFPLPDLNFCSTGAICDDFKAIVQRLAERGHTIHFWEMPQVREAEPHEPGIVLSSGKRVPAILLEIVEDELAHILERLALQSGTPVTEEQVRGALARSNRIRTLLARIRAGSLPGLERLVCEMMAIHYCSDYALCEKVLTGMVEESDRLPGVDPRSIPVYWINPVADLRVMNLVEEADGRICGTDFMFTHALRPLDETVPPLTALAQMVLNDPMAGTTQARMRACLDEARSLGAKGIILSRIPGASHCAFQGPALESLTDLPILEIEVASLIDPYIPTLMTRLQAFMESLRNRACPA